MLFFADISHYPRACKRSSCCECCTTSDTFVDEPADAECQISFWKLTLRMGSIIVLWAKGKI